MDAETRDTFREVAAAIRALNDANDAQDRVNRLDVVRMDAIDARLDALAAGLRALAADPGEVADAILKVVRDDAS